MSKSMKRRQKRLERKNAKRKAKRTQIARSRNLSLAQKMAVASTYPVYGCFYTLAIDDNGIGIVVVARKMPDGQIAMGLFLVDRYCLGVKDAFGRVLPRSDYDEFVVECEQKKGGIQELHPPTARRLVEDAIGYANDLGFTPHPDYRRAAPIFGDIDPEQATRTWEFGRDGKPFFVAGPYDTPARCRRIQNTLLQHCGPDGFDFVMPMSSPLSLSEYAIEADGDDWDDDDWEIVDDDE